MEVNLESYQGPLDLLLKLIRQHQIDIYDIPISTLTAEYIAAIEKLPPNMDELSEFLVMAATLLEIKSRMLLPRPKTENPETETEDPRAALVEKLLAYKQAQLIAQELRRIGPEGGHRVAGRGDRPLLKQFNQDAKSTFETDVNTLQKLNDLFKDVMAKKEEKRDVVRAGYGKMPRDRFTIGEKVAYIRSALSVSGRASLRLLLTQCHSKNEMVVTFLALLEMIRQGEVKAAQESAFDDVDIIPNI